MYRLFWHDPAGTTVHNFNNSNELVRWVWNIAGKQWFRHSFRIEQLINEEWQEPQNPKPQLLNSAPSPYPSWTWNDSTRQWEPPVARPVSPRTEYDLLWNEDTQGWGLENMSLSKLNDNGTHVVERKYFDTWDNLIKYLHSIDQIKNVYRQIADQEKLELINRKIISPYHDRFICLKIIES